MKISQVWVRIPDIPPQTILALKESWHIFMSFDETVNPGEIIVEVSDHIGLEAISSTHPESESCTHFHAITLTECGSADNMIDALKNAITFLEAHKATHYFHLSQY